MIDVEADFRPTHESTISPVGYGSGSFLFSNATKEAHDRQAVSRFRG
jgi:hypothetical protein